jgi:hypothetical protein
MSVTIDSTGFQIRLALTAIPGNIVDRLHPLISKQSKMKKIKLLLLLLMPFASFAEQPLPMVGSDIPVNVLMCKTAKLMEDLVKTAHSLPSADYGKYLAQKKSAGDCEVGGGAKISEVTSEPFLVTEKQRVYLLKVKFGGEDYYANFNRQ